MKRIVLTLLILMQGLSVLAADLPAAEFIARARGTARRSDMATYAKLHGMLQHRRRNSETLTMSIYFGMIIHPDRSIGQLVLDKSEGYVLSQAQKSGLTTVRKMPGSSENDRLGYVGVRASDLMMSFLFCQVEKELDDELLNGMIHCRVFLLDDKDNQEKIKVWIASEHAFPLKAEFYRYGENARFRELEASAFTQKNDLYYVRRLRLEGPGWSTRIDFDGETAEINVLQGPAPDIFIPLNEKQ